MSRMMLEMDAHAFAVQYGRGVTRAARRVDPPPSMETRTEPRTVLESQIRRLINEMEVGIILHDGGRIIELNKRVPLLSDYAVHELLGRRLEEFIASGSLLRLVHWLELNGHEPVIVLALRKTMRHYFVQLKRLASITYRGRRVQVTAITELISRSERDPEPGS